MSSSVDATICEWDPYAGKLLVQHREHRTAVQAVRFSPDGSLLASGSSDHDIALWDSTSTLKLREKLIAHNSEVRAVAFSSDGKYLASGSSDKDLFVWSVDTLQIEGESSTSGEIDGIEWYPDESAFISSDGTGAIIRWSVQDLDTVMGPFQDLLKEVESDTSKSQNAELIAKFENLQSQYSADVLRDKRIFYIMWQCKRALGLLKGATRK
ncbi:MAG: WD40 repeat domain-containing protein [Candidatus Thorarchaeota archaeon]